MAMTLKKSHRNREPRSSNFRLALIDDMTHQQLLTFHFTKTSLAVTLISILVILCVAIYAIVAYTPVRTFIPGYPDARSKRAAIQNAIRIDSLERVIYKWELYSESLKRVMEGTDPLQLDSMINANRQQAESATERPAMRQQDSLLRQHVREEEQFGISDRDRRDLPIEGRLFFTPLKGVVSQGYDPALHPYVDITAPAGSVVKATLDGTVIFAGWSEEAGYTIQIQHDGDIVSIYKHNEKLLKGTGDKVAAGSPIALVGNTGALTTGDHLHFELWHKGETVDPTRYINF
ncbi:MAG: M23 family metallopeptidase [Bacteroidales bacterium]|nr:M23 family metallopeptidase [Bacteroidales bacterium]